MTKELVAGSPFPCIWNEGTRQPAQVDSALRRSTKCRNPNINKFFLNIQQYRTFDLVTEYRYVLERQNGLF